MCESALCDFLVAIIATFAAGYGLGVKTERWLQSRMRDD